MHLLLMSAVATLSMLSPQASATTIPSGFSLIDSDTGVSFYERTVSGGVPDYVLVVDLTQAELRSTIGAVASAGSGSGALGGDDPTINKESLSTHWSNARGTWSDAFAVFNGQFFSTASDPTGLAFSLKMDGAHVSDGYGIAYEFPGEIDQLTVDNASGEASIDTFDSAYFGASYSPDEFIAGLDEWADKGIYSYTDRTFIGTEDTDSDGVGDVLLVFVSQLATQPYAANTLYDFGADDVIMFDGGGSTQLLVNGSSYVSSSRQIPHAFVVVAGSGSSPTSSLGDWDYCRDYGPCAAGEGDCDSDSECQSGTTCVNNVGATYGFGSGVDVCEASSSPTSSLGDWDYCRDYGPCAAGEGDCDSDSECQSGTTCVNNVGATYGYGSGVDVCEASSSPTSSLGDWDYCRDYGPCDVGEGDCDGSSECKSGLTCVNNVGATYGYGSGVDVCR